MGIQTDYDVIVVGAGPAGLSIASELSRFVKVLVIDKKGKASQCTKGWFVPTLSLDGKEEIPAHCHSEGIKRFICDTATQERRAWDARIDGGYRFIDEKAILTYWDDRVRRHGASGDEAKGKGSTVLYGTVCYNHAVTRDQVMVTTSMGNFSARMLVDASGHDSPIKKAYHKLTSRNMYWWSVYGWIVNHPTLPDYPGLINGARERMRVGDYLLWGTFKDLNADPDACLEEGRPVMEYEIIDEHTSFPMVLFLRRSKVSLDVMKAQFNHIINNEDLGRPFRVKDVDAIGAGNPRSKHIREVKYGWYPSGGLSQGFACDRVAFVGDAGCWSTPCGWGMAFILTNYKKYAQHLAVKIKEDSLDSRSLESLVKMARWEQMQIVVDQIAAHFLSHVPPNLIDKFIDFWNREAMTFLYCEKLFTLTITMPELDHLIACFGRAFEKELPMLVKSFPLVDLRLAIKAVSLWGQIGWSRKLALVEHMIEVITKDWDEGPWHELLHDKLKELKRDVEMLTGERPQPQIAENGFDFLDYSELRD